jgi:hypothetical protein
LRKTVIAACVAALALVVAAVAMAATTHSQTIDAAVSPSKAGTTKAPKPITLQVHLAAQTSDGSVPPASKHTVTYFGRGIVFNGAPFKSCTLETLNDPNKGPSKCPTESKIGGGSATAHVGNDPNGPDETLQVTVVNGPKGKSTLFHLKGTVPVAVNAAFAGKIVKIRSGAFGYKLDVVIPKALYNPVGTTYTPLTDFNVKIKAVKRVSGKQVGILSTVSCPKRKKWPFKATFEYANAPEVDNAQDLVSCSR